MLFGGLRRLTVGATTSCPIINVLFSDSPIKLSSETSVQATLHKIVTLLKLLIVKFCLASLAMLAFVWFKVPLMKMLQFAIFKVSVTL